MIPKYQFPVLAKTRYYYIKAPQQTDFACTFAS